jgi:hypothetical protein
MAVQGLYVLKQNGTVGFIRVEDITTSTNNTSLFIPSKTTMPLVAVPLFHVCQAYLPRSIRKLPTRNLLVRAGFVKDRIN